MSIKKILLLASMALATTAFVAPSMASAATFTITDNGPVLDKTTTFSGIFQFNTLGSGLECELVATVTVNKDEVDITALEIPEPTTKCKFFGAKYENCEFEEHPKATRLPWGVDVTGLDTVTLTDSTVKNETGETQAAEVSWTLKTKTVNDGASKCSTTKNKLTIGVPGEVAKTDIPFEVETKNGFIDALVIESGAKIKEDVDAAAGGTISVGVSGTFTIAKADTETYTISETK